MTKDAENIKAITNAFLVLDVLAELGNVGVSEIARHTSIAKTTVFRIIKTLENLGAVVQVTGDIYSLGYVLVKYQPQAVNQEYLIRVASPFMKEFALETGESINLAILNQNQVYIIHTQVGERYLLQSTLLPTVDLYCSSMGKIFLGAMSEEELRHYFAQERVAYTLNTITSAETFLKENEVIKETQIAYDKEEFEYGLSCFSTGIYQAKQLIAAIGCSGPTSRLQVKGQAYLEECLLKTASLINQALNQPMVSETQKKSQR